METAIVTLEIKYDPAESDHPATWDWAALLDLPDPDDVEVLGRNG